MRIARLGRELRRLGSEIEHDETPPATATATATAVAAAAAAAAADTAAAATAATAAAAASTASGPPQSPPAVLSRPRDTAGGDGASLASSSIAWEGGAVPPLWGSGGGQTPQWPLEPTPIEVPPAEREVLATHSNPNPDPDPDPNPNTNPNP